MDGQNMLILGYAKDKMPAIIHKFSTIEECISYYGEKNTISEAYNIAKKFTNADIFTISFSQYSDFSTIVDVISKQHFTYIVPVDIYISEYYNDPHKGNEKTFYIQYLLEETPFNLDSVFVTTDKHAKLYETQEDFISDMSNKILQFKKNLRKESNMRNLIFVDNILENYSWANVCLAAAICDTPIIEYPDAREDFGKSIFQIDAVDIADEQVYFKNNYLINTSIENLLNFDKKGSLKVVAVDRIIRHIYHNIDFTDYVGTFYSKYKELKIKESLIRSLESLKGVLIYDYKIDSISAESTQPNTINIVIYFSVWIKNCIEWYHGKVII